MAGCSARPDEPNELSNIRLRPQNEAFLRSQKRFVGSFKEVFLFWSWARLFPWLATQWSISSYPNQTDIERLQARKNKTNTNKRGRARVIDGRWASGFGCLGRSY